MSWEQPAYSGGNNLSTLKIVPNGPELSFVRFIGVFNYGQPPTPTKTPTSGTFGQTPFQTPKAESSFCDPRVTWNTADPCAASPTLIKTPQLALTTPTTKRPSTAFSQKRLFSERDLESEIASHVHHPSPNPSLPLPPVEPSRQLSSSPNPTSGQDLCSELEQDSHSPKLGLIVDTNPVTHSASLMQTPPPTSATSSKRKVQQAKAIKSKHHSVVGSRRMSVPELGVAVDVEGLKRGVENSPLQLSGLQFSPDALIFPLSGPATTPAHPQHKIFWEPGQSDGMEIDFAANLDNPFNTDSRLILDPFIPTTYQQLANQESDTSYFSNFSEDVAKAFSNVSTSTNKQSHPIPHNRPTTDKSTRDKFLEAAVNPSLLFSSPSRSSRPVDKLVSTTQILDEDAFQPYAYQIQEAKREKALSEVRKPTKKRKPVSDSPAVKAVVEALREDGLDQSTSRQRFDDISPTRTSSEMVSQRNSKRVKQGLERVSLSELRCDTGYHEAGSKRRHRHTAVSLTIDASGRARTETRTVVEDHNSDLDEGRMLLQSDSSSDSSSNGSSPAMITSQASSFASVRIRTKQPKLGRFSTISKSHSQKSSSASVYTSSSYADNLSQPLSIQNPTNANAHPHKVVYRKNPQGYLENDKTTYVPNEAFDEAEVSEAETVLGPEDPTGMAQFELRKMFKGHEKVGTTSLATSRKIGDIKRFKSRAYLSIERMAPSCGIAGILTPDTQNVFGLSKLSPTTMTDLESIRSVDGSIKKLRCICQGSSNDGQLILCESCKSWLHMKCTGLSPEGVPQIYLCGFCTGQTSIKEGRGRKRLQAEYRQPRLAMAQNSLRT